jgi:hypothetical protein
MTVITMISVSLAWLNDRYADTSCLKSINLRDRRLPFGILIVMGIKFSHLCLLKFARSSFRNETGGNELSNDIEKKCEENKRDDRISRAVEEHTEMRD